MRPQISIRKYLGIALALAALLIFAPPALAQHRIKLGTLAPRDTSLYHSLQGMGQQWRAAPGGGVELTVYPGTLGSESDLIRRMQVGQLQAALLSAAGLAEIEPQVGALQKMPLVFRSLDEVDYVRTRLQPRLAERLLQKGFVVLSWGDTGWVRFFTRQPVLMPADLRKMKLFVTAGDAAQADIMRAGGYSAVPLEWSDVLTSLQTGMIDAVPVTPFYALAGQYHTVARHMIEVNWVPLAGAIVITKRAWDSLPQETRAAMIRAAEETGAEITRITRTENETAVQAMQKRGLQVHALTPEAETEWRRTAEQFYPTVRSRLVPAETFDEVLRLLAEYRAAHADQKPANAAGKNRGTR